MPLQLFTTARATEPDEATLLAALRAQDPSAAVFHTLASNAFTVRKLTAWTAAQIAAAQTIIDTSAPSSKQLSAQDEIDRWPIAMKALVLTLIDQINVLRTAAGLPTVTTAQALQAVRNKAATL